jgi:acetolactate synthase-1/2/3 large subunit
VPIKVALINNGNLGMVRQWQTLFYGERYSQHRSGDPQPADPDFVKLAEAMGCVGMRCEREEDVDDVIRAAREINDRPVVIDFIVGADAQVWPMVAAGTSNDEIMAARDIRPLFDNEDRSDGCHYTHSVGPGRGQARRPGPGGGAVRRRGFNIESLAVGATEAEEHVADDDRRHGRGLPLEQITKQLNKLINVIKIVEQDGENSVSRELALIKVRADAGTRSQVIEAVNLFRAKVVDVSTESLTIEATGTRRRLLRASSRTASVRSCSPGSCRWHAAAGQGHPRCRCAAMTDGDRPRPPRSAPTKEKEKASGS